MKLLGFDKKSQESVYVERILCDSGSVEGASSVFSFLYRMYYIDFDLRILIRSECVPDAGRRC